METKGKRAVVIGGGFGGMATAALMARDGFDVTVLERNDRAGGRAREWKKDGFTFDMGPSWYLMPEVFDRYFSLFGEKRADWYDLVRLDPSYRVFFGPGEKVDVRSEPEAAAALFEGIEPGAGAQLRKYLDAAAFKYEVAMREFLYREYRTVFDFLNRRMLVDGLKMKVLGSLDAEVSKRFKDRRLRQILEYEMVFLGTAPKDAPGLYSLLSHVDLTQGVFYPMGGLTAVADAVRRLAESRGARFELSAEADAIRSEGRRAKAVAFRRLDAEGRPTGERGELEADVVVAGADYAHVETSLLDASSRSYGEKYWASRVVAPSMFVVYLGLSKRLEGLAHHNLYFQEDWDRHFDAIFKKPAWPEDPCFYLSAITKSDPGMAPKDGENLFLLVPTAAGLEDDDSTRERYADMALRHAERMLGEKLLDSVKVKRIFSQRDFARDYNAYKGTALGLSHTLGQTAVFRPSLRSRKLSNLLYAGQYTHPGIGVPMVLMAAELAAKAASEL